MQPPPIPEFSGHFQPKSERLQRFRVYFGKIGEMALVGHLDLVRLFDRTVRRAALPISFTGGYHPGPRISIANALTLGVTSSGEIVDFELTKAMNIDEFRHALTKELPSDIPILRVEEVPVNSTAATRLLEEAEYLITVGTEDIFSEEVWQNWLTTVLESSEINWEKTTKSGKKKTVNLRERLSYLSLESYQNNTAILRYIGSCRNDGTMLQPQQVILMLEKISGIELQLTKIHRQRLILAAS